jgi:putative MATE family efflux protein
LVNLFIGLSVGANILAARFYGARDREGMHQTVHTAMLLSVISGVFLMVVGVFGAETILTWMNSPEEVRSLAAVYLRIYFLGMPATMLYNFGAAILRATGDTQRPLYYLTFAGVVNVALNLLLVIVFRMDVAGVGIATVASQVISAALVVRCMMRASGAVHLELRELKIYPVRLKQIMQVGVPAGFQGVLFSLANVVIQSSVNSFGEIVVAGNAAASNIDGFIYVAMNSIYQATISFTSQNYGAGRYERIRPILLRSLGCVLTIGLLLGNLSVLFGPQLLGIYSDSAPVIAAGLNRMKILCTTYCLCGVMEVMAGVLRGLGYSVMPMIVSLIGACGLRLIWIATLFRIPAFHSINTLYWSYPVSWLVTIAAHTGCYLWAIKRLKRSLGLTNQTISMPQE